MSLKAMFSMNQVADDVPWWKYWISLFSLTTFTVCAAFSLQYFHSRYHRSEASEPYVNVLNRAKSICDWFYKIMKGST